MMGARDATPLLKKKKVKEFDESVDVPDEIYLMMPTILEEVKQMVRSLPTREVMQSVLEEEVRNLATAVFPYPSQRSKHINYVRTACTVLKTILKDNDKIIVEETALGKSVVVDNTCNSGDKVGVGGDNEDEDLDTHNYPLI